MKTKKSIGTVMDALEQYLRERNQRLTPERMMVVDAMMKHKGAFTLEKITEDIEKESFAVSRSTVYNTVSLLVAAGLLDCVHVPVTNSNVYSVRRPNTSRLYYICNSCGKVRALAGDPAVKLPDTLDFRTFAPVSFVMCVYGMCRKCNKTLRENKSNQQ